MNLKFYFDYLGKCNQMLKELVQEKGGSTGLRIYFWIDYLWAAMRHGCLIRHYVYGDFYKMSSFERKRSLTYPRICKIFKKCNDPKYIHLLESKRDFNLHFSKFVKRDWLYNREASYDEFREFVFGHDSIIVKPLELCEGHGIFRVDNVRTEAAVKELYNRLNDAPYMLEECIVPDKGMEFGNKSVNTLKIDTLLKKDGEVFVFKPALRVGVGDAVVDNYGSGGCVYDVDLELGIVMCPSFSKDNKQHRKHPGTDITMIGYQIPHWQEVINSVTEAAKMLPQCRFIGWDVAITPDGIDLIEGNHNLDYELMEFQGIHRGWWHELNKYI